VLQEGEADGTIVGGNLCTLNLLQGTPFMPPLEGSVVFAEDDERVRPWDFDRNLVSLLQQPAFAGVRGLVIGRFQRATGMTRDLLAQVVASKPGPAGLPVIANVDFGHTTSIVTFPVGGTVEVRAEPSALRLTITSH
jgi:muramoyltetrapeptide carboxypeptidase